MNAPHRLLTAISFGASQPNVVITADACGQDSIAQITVALPVGP